MSEINDSSSSIDTSASPDTNAESIAENIVSDDSSDTVEAKPVAAKAPVKPAAPVKPPESKKYKIKVDGGEEELDEETVLKLAQLGRASNKRFQEAASTKKQAEEFIRLLKSDPAKVLTHPNIGVDLKKFSEDYLMKFLEQQEMSPEQRKLAEYEERFRQQEEKEKTDAEAKAAQEKQQLQEHYAKDYEQKIMGALSTSGLPKTEYTVKRMAAYMKSAIDQDIDLEPQYVAKLVRNDYLKEISALIGQSDGDALLEILGGDSVVNKIRKYDIAKLKAGRNQPAAVPNLSNEPAQKSVYEAPKNPNKYMSTHEWREMMDKKRNS